MPADVFFSASLSRYGQNSGHFMSYNLKKTVVLVGMMGAGKTAVGRVLASKLNVPFLDSDAAIETAANMSIAEIFERDGELFFRGKESQVIERLLESEQCILSTGGGAYLAENNRKMISDKGIAVWLNADIDLLWNRVKNKDTRPLLRTPEPRKTLEDIFSKRVPFYRLADLPVKTKAGFSIEQTAGKVIDALKTRLDVLEETAP